MFETETHHNIGEEINSELTPNNFINKTPNRYYKLTCEKHGLYYSVGTRSACPICYPITCECCGAETRYLHRNICPYCWNSCNKTFELNEEKLMKAICVCDCEIHGKYLAGSSVANCPVCEDFKQNKCVIKECNNLAIKGYIICEECMKTVNSTFNHEFERIRSSEPKEPQYDERGYKIVNWSERIYLKECQIHGYFTCTTAHADCPVCTKIEEFKKTRCKVCGEEKAEFGSVCESCYETLDCNFDRTALKETFRNEAKNDDKTIENPNRKNLYLLECQEHGFHLSAGPIGVCKRCEIERNKSKNVKYYEELIANNLHSFGTSVNKVEGEHTPIIMFELPKLIEEKRHIPCVRCGREFNSHNCRTFCGHCHVLHTCEVCGFHFLDRGDNPTAKVCSHACATKLKWSSGVFDHKVNPFKGNIKSDETNLQNIEIEEFLPEQFTQLIGEINDNFKEGVWLKYNNTTQEVLDICITKNIPKEIEFHHYAIENDSRFKYREMNKMILRNDEINFYYVGSFEDWLDGLRIEFETAIKYKAKFWNPAPGIQMTWMNEVKAKS